MRPASTTSMTEEIAQTAFAARRVASANWLTLSPDDWAPATGEESGMTMDPFAPTLWSLYQTRTGRGVLMNPLTRTTPVSPNRFRYVSRATHPLSNATGSEVTTTTKLGWQCLAARDVPAAVAISDRRVRTNSPCARG